ncbi:MAG: NnrU family protein [Rubrivivax sp.]
MTALVIGLVIFLGVHSVRVFAEPLRTDLRTRLGENGYKGLYTLLSLAGFALVVWGFGQSRLQPVPLWAPMLWARHLASLLMLVSFVFLAAAYVPRNGIKAKLHHPMTLGVKTWALAHLLANNTLAEALLFGGFLVWSVLVFRAARARDRAAGTVYPPGTLAGTLTAVAAGAVAWAVFAFWAHGFLIGVNPF